MPATVSAPKEQPPGISQAKGPQGEGILESRRRFTDTSPKVKAGSLSGQSLRFEDRAGQWLRANEGCCQ